VGACVLHWASCRPLPCCASTFQTTLRRLGCHCHHLPAPLHRPFDLVIAADWCVVCSPFPLPSWQPALPASLVQRVVEAPAFCHADNVRRTKYGLREWLPLFALAHGSTFFSDSHEDLLAALRKLLVGTQCCFCTTARGGGHSSPGAQGPAPPVPAKIVPEKPTPSSGSTPPKANGCGGMGKRSGGPKCGTALLPRWHSPCRNSLSCAGAKAFLYLKLHCNITQPFGSATLACCSNQPTPGSDTPLTMTSRYFSSCASSHQRWLELPR